MRGRRNNVLTRIDVPEALARQLQQRYCPIVKRVLEISAVGASLDLEALLLSIYLQGVIDGANPQVQARLAAEEAEAGTCVV